MFEDRADAGRKLAQRLIKYKSGHPVIVALPRGGVPIGYEVAHFLVAPLDILIVRKLGFPGQPELAIGAIADGDNYEIVMNSEMSSNLELPPMYIEKEVAAKLAEIQAMKSAFRGHRPVIGVEKRITIVVDDGIATGATMRVVVRRLRREKPQQIVVATPVASQQAVDLLSKEVDDIVCLHVPDDFTAVGGFYEDFHPVTDEEVTRLLDLAREHPKSVEKAR